MRILSVLMILLLIVAFVACGTAKGRYDGEDLDDDDDDNDDNDVSDDDVSIDDDDDDDAEKIDDFTWTDADGNSVNLYDLEGNVILLNVGAGWCAGCREETPSLQSDIWEQFQNDDFLLIQLIVEDPEGNPADQDYAATWRDEFGVTYTVCYDPGWSLQPYFTASTLPFSMLLDKQLGIRLQTHEYDADVYALMIEDLL